MMDHSIFCKYLEKADLMPILARDEIMPKFLSSEFEIPQSNAIKIISKKKINQKNRPEKQNKENLMNKKPKAEKNDNNNEKKKNWNKKSNK